ncbi:MAG: N-6 DNA methylase [Leadbetterella sp.]|uniref:type ISP restriction/modification enzyme n=1 Tax=Flavobacterium sp. TaxID=239 RepID=UPI001B7AB6EB|nr:type ISP restriction/modification enzyme [Flavobacterium sp.]MBP6183065.1 N-6 DNA methylase [Flavobacterium sp.]MBP8155582.1 N-6 DNA methylase [Leadbetterella sp.]
MTLEQYIDNINKRYQLGNATEHTFRGDLQQLLESLVPDIRATNEPKRQSCGAPDYILTKGEIPVGFIEAKDIGDKDLEGAKKTGNKEQFDRYKASLNNLIFTDYLDFHLYIEGVFITKIAIASIQNGAIVPLPENFVTFTNLIKDFASHLGQTIKSSKKLAEMMAGKARLLSDVIEKALTTDVNDQEDSTLKDQMVAFKEILIHDITPKGFADVYAQTIAYGMFAARLHDATLPTFSRQEAAELIPKSNPFLRKLFGYIAGPDIDDRIKWIVDSLVDIFLACNVEEILKNYGKSTKMEDPIIHFYETFLSEYDPKLRKARGVWYTPAPVVNFIVRAVDDILKTEFDLPQGLADTSKTKIKVDLQGKKVEQEVHKVQILDPATGTGTFLAETIKHIHKKFEGQQGIWSNYVETHLLPRLNGFELLMASYAMAHLKLDLLLTETGFKPTSNQRLRVYLTNSLEESHPDTGTLFANWLSSEANEANHIKRDAPVMCVIGNPPYSGESANKGEWIMKLMEDYKKEPGGKEKLKERNPKWINDDYVKFLRYGQHFIEKNGSGILAFINPHGFLDNPTFRGMRWNLLKTYDKIYTIDLHGNSKKKETAPDGSADVNVFDIMQGVSINIFVKTGKKKADELGKVFHFDLFGKREMKYDFLIEKSLRTISYKELPNVAPNYFFTNKDFDEQNKFNKGFSLNELFIINSAGIVTARDEFTIHFSKEEVKKTIEEFIDLDDETARRTFNLGRDVRDWSVAGARNDLKNSGLDFSNIVRIVYRPFEERYTYFTGTTKGFHCMPRGEVMKHLFKKDNICLICPKQVPDKENSGVYISKFISGHKTCSAYNINNIFPLYLYPETNGQQTIDQTTKRTPNLNPEIVRQIAAQLGLNFVPERHCEERSNPNNTTKDCFVPRSDGDDTFAPIDLLDYIYAVLHSPNYREKYKEFLKIDFPRVPYPKDAATFWQLVKLGEQIRQIHLLESAIVEKYITGYPEDGDNVVVKPRFVIANDSEAIPTNETASCLAVTGSVYINDTQYFSNVPEIAWNFYIGGYQPAQKWLKDRKDRKLEFDDILHYQKIIVALSETDRLMKEVDAIEIE